MNWFYGVELGLKSTLYFGIRAIFELILTSVCWPYHVTRYRFGPPIICYPTHELIPIKYI